jgi:hypothetical protein
MFSQELSRNGFSAKNTHKIVYPNLNSAMRPIPHDDNLPLSEPPENGLAFLEQMECEANSSLEAIQHSSDGQYIPEKRTSEQNYLIGMNYMIPFEPFLCQKTKQNLLLLD